MISTNVSDSETLSLQILLIGYHLSKSYDRLCPGVNSNQNESVTEYGLRLNKTEILNFGIQYLYIYISFNAMSTIRELLPQKLSAENNDTIYLIVSAYRLFLAAIDQIHCRFLYL